MPPPNKDTQIFKSLEKAMKNNSKVFTLGLIVSWYSSNVRVLLLNKYLFNKYGFKYPIFLTICHMTTWSLLIYITVAWIKMVPMQTIQSRVQFLKISTLNLVFCVLVMIGNICLRFMAVSFNHAVGDTKLFFTTIFAYLMALKRDARLTSKNSMNLLLYMAPIADVFLFPTILIIEENVIGITLALARDDIKINLNIMQRASLTRNLGRSHMKE
ncbi:putative sugar phosphate/phosphate translocator [Hibiscus syriacus]|uniref:Sugar phosphate/phosphate translocator n=1 Tax=Hibiscus syriacus TaxID=106335 RepID=A0A6A2ZXF5_HIBSY|nr:putative sugar phosphate/phosphate translocator [Hibiscus syriacus]